MTVVARMLTQEQDGIPGYMAHPEGSGRRPGILMAHHAHGVTADYLTQRSGYSGLARSSTSRISGEDSSPARRSRSWVPARRSAMMAHAAR